MHLSRIGFRPLLAVLSIAVAGAAIAVGCTGDDDAKCASGECLEVPDGSVSVPDGAAADGGGSTGDALAADASADDASDAAVTQEDASDSAAATDAPDDSASVTDAADDAPDASDGGPMPILSGVSGPWRLAVGGGYAYATTAGDVVKVALTGGSPTTITQAPSIEWVAADATNVYFTTLGGTVYKRAHNGTTNVAISNASVALTVSGVALDATHVYWTENVSGGKVKRVAIDGSTMAGETVSPGFVLPEGLALNATDTYVAESAGNTGNGRIVRLNPDGGAAIPLTTGRTGPSKPVLDPARIYWFENGGSSTGPIYSMPLDGGTIAKHANTAVDPSLVTDGSIFYYGNASGGIVKIDVAGASAMTLYSSSQTGDVYGLAVSGSSLYWTDFTGGRIMTAAK